MPGGTDVSRKTDAHNVQNKEAINSSELSPFPYRDCKSPHIIRTHLSIVMFFTTHCSLRLIVRYELDVPTSSNRRLHACHHARAPSGGRWNCGREMSENFCLNADLHVTFRDILHAVKLRHGTWRLYFPSEGRRAEDFFALKIWRLRLDVNLRTLVPKASTLSLDYRCSLCFMLAINKLHSCRIFHNLHNIKGLKRKFRG